MEKVLRVAGRLQPLALSPSQECLPIFFCLPTGTSPKFLRCNFLKNIHGYIFSSTFVPPPFNFVLYFFTYISSLKWGKFKVTSSSLLRGKYPISGPLLALSPSLLFFLFFPLSLFSLFFT